MYFLFDQNNTGGTWRIDEKVSEYVIIEADTPEEADKIAEDIGIYFDGCDLGWDCPCCGDRWHRTYNKGETKEEIISHLNIIVEVTTFEGKYPLDLNKFRFHLRQKSLPFNDIRLLTSE